MFIPCAGNGKYTNSDSDNVISNTVKTEVFAYPHVRDGALYMKNTVTVVCQFMNFKTAEIKPNPTPGWTISCETQRILVPSSELRT